MKKIKENSVVLVAAAVVAGWVHSLGNIGGYCTGNTRIGGIGLVFYLYTVAVPDPLGLPSAPTDTMRTAERPGAASTGRGGVPPPASAAAARPSDYCQLPGIALRAIKMWVPSR